MTALLWVLAAALAGGPQGWRYDGSGRWPADRSPSAWSTESVAWATELPAWSNGSPVVVQDRVCATAEPTTLLCADVASGKVLWTADNPTVDAVEPDRRDEVAAAVARAEQLEKALSELRATYGKLLRQARATGRSDLAEQATVLAAESDRLKADLEQVDRWRTPPNQGMVGWSSPTPATDGTAIYALFANGVVAAYELDGARRWTRWLGEPAEPMLGWDDGHAASPLVVGDTVIAPFGRLTALDARTGEVRWQGEHWVHYGPPVATKVSGIPVLITPSGQVVRVSDGKVLKEGLADMWYLGPVVEGDRVYLLEARSDQILREQGGLELIAWRLAGLDGEALDARALWRTRVPLPETCYAGPAVADGVLHLVTHGARVWTLDALTGEVLGDLELGVLRPTIVYASPTVAAGHLYVTDELGRTAVLTRGRDPRLLGVSELWPTRASPAFEGSRMFVRTERHLVAVDAR